MATAIELIQEYKPNKTIAEALIKADHYLNQRGYENIVASVSGGSDSDVVMDICERLKPHGVHYIWFDTGLEYQATKDHLIFLENKYGVEIERIKPKMSIPAANRKFGSPFMSKMISEQIGVLQKHGYDWIDRPYEEFQDLYPNVLAAGKWLYNQYTNSGFRNSTYDINRVRFLREFMFENPPTFPISDKCCYYAKKKPSKEYIRTHNVDLMMTGIRKAEGGVRAANYTSCFTEHSSKYNTAQFRPIFWFTNADKEEYEKLFDVTHSRCYTEYGFKRTGCVGCPFGGQDTLDALEVIKDKEPKLYKLAMAMFGKSYEYQKQFYAFRERMKKELDGQMSFFDMDNSQ